MVNPTSSKVSVTVNEAAALKAGRPRVLVAIPCYNEALAIGSMVLRAKAHADEVLVVDDGSSDETQLVAQLAGATVIRHTENGGKGKGVKTAFRYARDQGFQALVLMDGDGQHDPEEIPLLLEPILGRNGSSVDIALGFRFGDKTEMPAWRRVGKRILDYATAATAGSGQVVDSQCGYRAYGRRAIEAFAHRLMGKGFGTESEQLMLANELGLTTENVTIHCRYEGLDGSTQGPVRHAMGVLFSLLDFVTLKHPLVTLALPGVLLALASLGLGFQVIQTFQQTGELAVGYAVLTAVLAMVGALAILTGLLMRLISRFVELSRARGERSI